RVPAGVGCEGILRLGDSEFNEVLATGARWCLRKGYATADDLARTEDGGALAGADPAAVSPRAIERGHGQIGTLGSGNHYLEIQMARPQDVFDAAVAARFGFA